MDEDQQLFPLPFNDFIIVSLENEPVFHGSLTREQVAELLTNDGEFLLYAAPKNELVLAVRSEEMYYFNVRINQTLAGPLFHIGKNIFHNFDAMVHFITTHTFIVDSDSFKAKKPKLSAAKLGRLGALKRVSKLQPRCTAKSRLPIINKTSKRLLVPLRKDIVVNDVTIAELEELVKLRHFNIVALLDFQTSVNYTSDLVVLEYECFSTSLPKYMKSKTVSMTRKLQWMTQASKVTTFLRDKEYFNTILCVQDCFVDSNHNLKVSMIWKGDWSCSLSDTVNHPYYWRMCSPEYIMLEKKTKYSLIYNLGVFMWQIVTDNKMLPFGYHGSAFTLMQHMKDEELMFPGRKRSKTPAGRNEKLGALIEAYKQKMDLLPRVNDQIVSIILECTQLNMEDRMLMNSITQKVDVEATITMISSRVQKILPFT